MQLIKILIQKLAKYLKLLRYIDLSLYMRFFNTLYFFNKLRLTFSLPMIEIHFSCLKNKTINLFIYNIKRKNIKHIDSYLRSTWHIKKNSTLYSPPPVLCLYLDDKSCTVLVNLLNTPLNPPIFSKQVLINFSAIYVYAVKKTHDIHQDLLVSMILLILILYLLPTIMFPDINMYKYGIQ